MNCVEINIDNVMVYTITRRMNITGWTIYIIKAAVNMVIKIINEILKIVY